jgi:hypothetical protein
MYEMMHSISLAFAIQSSYIEEYLYAPGHRMLCFEYSWIQTSQNVCPQDARVLGFWNTSWQIGHLRSDSSRANDSRISTVPRTGLLSTLAASNVVDVVLPLLLRSLLLVECGRSLMVKVCSVYCELSSVYLTIRLLLLKTLCCLSYIEYRRQGTERTKTTTHTVALDSVSFKK